LKGVILFDFGSKLRKTIYKIKIAISQKTELARVLALPPKVKIKLKSSFLPLSPLLRKLPCFY
jgi:hypothetical protein